MADVGVMPSRVVSGERPASKDRPRQEAGGAEPGSRRRCSDRRSGRRRRTRRAPPARKLLRAGPGSSRSPAPNMTMMLAGGLAASPGRGRRLPRGPTGREPQRQPGPGSGREAPSIRRRTRRGAPGTRGRDWSQPHVADGFWAQPTGVRGPRPAPAPMVGLRREVSVDELGQEIRLLDGLDAGGARDWRRGGRTRPFTDITSSGPNVSVHTTGRPTSASRVISEYARRITMGTSTSWARRGWRGARRGKRRPGCHREPVVGATGLEVLLVVSVQPGGCATPRERRQGLRISFISLEPPA